MDFTMPASLWGDMHGGSPNADVDGAHGMTERKARHCIPSLPTPRPSIESPDARLSEDVKARAGQTIYVAAAAPLSFKSTDSNSSPPKPMSPVPGLSRSPVTPVTPAHALPATPCGGSRPFPAVINQERSHVRDASSLDPTSLFVGGLSPGAWDQEKLKMLFGKYGEVENVKVVQPGGWLYS
jgi:hypothetical protein